MHRSCESHILRNSFSFGFLFYFFLHSRVLSGVSFFPQGNCQIKLTKGTLFKACKESLTNESIYFRGHFTSLHRVCALKQLQVAYWISFHLTKILLRFKKIQDDSGLECFDGMIEKHDLQVELLNAL